MNLYFIIILHLFALKKCTLRMCHYTLSMCQVHGVTFKLKLQFEVLYCPSVTFCCPCKFGGKIDGWPLASTCSARLWAERVLMKRLWSLFDPGCHCSWHGFANGHNRISSSTFNSPCFIPGFLNCGGVNCLFLKLKVFGILHTFKSNK